MPGNYPRNKQLVLRPAQVGLNGTTVVAGVPVTAIINTAEWSMLSLGFRFVRVDASVWTVQVEWSPNYVLDGAANALWFRIAMETPSAGTSTLDETTWSDTSAVTHNIGMDVPLNYPAVRISVDNTGGTTDTVTCWAVLGAA